MTTPEVRSLLSGQQFAPEQQTELYLGVVAPVGVRRQSFVSALRRELRRFGYELRVHRLSDRISDFQGWRVDDANEDSRLRSAMRGGTGLREQLGTDILVRAAMNEIAHQRSTEVDPSPSVAHLFWSLKHPEEVATLRLVYSRGFHLIGLHASRKDRVRGLLAEGALSRGQAESHIDLDEDESGAQHGQKTRKTFQHADVFLPWDHREEVEPLQRFLELVFGKPTLTPHQDEQWMFTAFASAVRSGELSRQVGAALVSEASDLLAVGANDAPRAQGGLHWPGENDDRDLVHGFDSNTRVRDELLERVAQSLAASDGPMATADVEEVAAHLSKTELRDITEYGRAVHAEMDALLTAGRTGTSTRNSTLYVTTFPCHNCARHLIAAGVRRVVYVEPYPKSKALELHAKELETEAEESEARGRPRVRIEHFLGVGARRFLDYFSMHLSEGLDMSRKQSDGSLVEWVPERAVPRVPLYFESFNVLEAKFGSTVAPHQDSETPRTQNP